MTDKILEVARGIRKKHTHLDPTWSADRENRMIMAGIERGRPMEGERIIGIINDLNSIDYPYGGDYKRAILKVLKGEK